MAQPIMPVKLQPVILQPFAAYAERSVNVANRLSEILRFTVPNRVYWEIESGTVPILKLYGASAQISRRSRVVFLALAPGARAPKEFAELDYDPFYALSTDQQADKDFQARLQLVIDGGGVTLPEAYQLHVWLESPDTIDWDNVQTVFSLRVMEGRLRG